jgi:hypothetical protein
LHRCRSTACKVSSRAVKASRGHRLRRLNSQRCSHVTPYFQPPGCAKTVARQQTWLTGRRLCPEFWIQKVVLANPLADRAVAPSRGAMAAVSTASLLVGAGPAASAEEPRLAAVEVVSESNCQAAPRSSTQLPRASFASRAGCAHRRGRLWSSLPLDRPTAAKTASMPPRSSTSACEHRAARGGRRPLEH